MSTSRLPTTLTAVLLAAVLAACTPATSDGGEVRLEPGARVEQVRAARAALLEPVPTVTAEAERLVATLEELWTAPSSGQQRSAVVASLRTQPFDDAVAALRAVELEGEGPDVTAARAAVATLLDDASALASAVEEEHAELVAVATFDDDLDTLLEQWDAPGQYSAQLAAFEQLAADARALAATAAGRVATPPCVGVWERREVAAMTVADRTDELRALVRDRRGQEFDELRDAYRQDPFGLGALLVDLDAEAAQGCWADASAVPTSLTDLLASRDELAAALDPADL